LLVVLVVQAADARAQHAPDSDIAALGCAACHTSHSGGSTEYNLEIVPVPEFEVQVPDLGQSSRSCLRCHGDGVVPGAASNSLGRPFRLGPSLADDHPLGSRRLGTEFRIPGASLESTDPGESLALGLDAGEAVECTACHDPHDRSGDPMLKAGESATCARCHDATARGIQNHRSVECSGCHRLHEGAGKLLTDDRSDRMCGYCHLPGYPAPMQVADPSTRARESAILAPMDETHTTDLAGGCLQCHPVH
jgi:predicted CXXCH cytochrome family protein